MQARIMLKASPLMCVVVLANMSDLVVLDNVDLHKPPLDTQK